jgi:hypothetical protein
VLQPPHCTSIQTDKKNAYKGAYDSLFLKATFSLYYLHKVSRWGERVDKILWNIFAFFLVVVGGGIGGFELRASRLLGRHSATWAILPATFLFKEA